jgi:hypothetical protein
MQNKPTMRENRLAELRNKLKQKQVSISTNAEPVPAPVPPILTSAITVPASYAAPSNIIRSPLQFADTGSDAIATKRTTKKTTKRKYTLGRSSIRKSVAVLIKDRGTRKQVLNAQKDLKRKPINDVKIYLREHNLIKVGSNAPNDVMRKMYESAMLAGEIKNSNVETLLHNFSKDDKEL